MKRMKQLLFIALTALSFTSCIKMNDDEPVSPVDPTDPNTSKVISGTIDKDLVIKTGTYTLKGYVYVNNGATLTIQPGTIVKSDVTEKGALIVERGAKLIAEGTADQPIVFTSGKAAGERNPGDWGGIILLGKAPTNRPTSPAPIIEGGVNRPYGGTDPNDNSGILKYVRIEFSGIAAEPNSEINGLTLGGVGAGTVLENIQVSYGGDDAYEFFGGTVNAKNLIAFATYDDDFDFDFGYTGKIQFAVSLRDKPADTDAANGIEADNDGAGTNATPYTHPVLSNFTFIGPYDTTGSAATHNFSNRWRRSVHFTLYNSILAGHKKGGFSMESAGTVQDYYVDNLSAFKNNIVAVYTNPYLVDSVGARVIATGHMANPMTPEDRTAMINEAKSMIRAKAESEGNITLASREDIQLNDPFNLNAPNFLPKAGSPAASGANFTGLDANFFNTSVAYRGAFGSTDWTAKWASFNPRTNAY